MQTFKDYQETRRKQLYTHISNYLELKKKQAQDPLSDIALSRLHDFTTSGKMLRGIFVMFSYELFGGKIDKNILNLATVMELSQASLLIHDDIMDNDVIRRNKPTIYAQYMEDAKNSKIEKPEEYGKSMGMIVGDSALFLIYELIGSMDSSPVIKSELLRTYSHEMLKVALGQFMDYHFGKTPEERTETEISHMYHLKTGSYSFMLPFELGAEVAKINVEQSNILEKITMNLGVVFQIKDDELGLFGQTAVTGKAKGADVKEGKKTLLRALLFEKANKEEKGCLNKLYGKDITQNDMKYITSLLDKYKILDSINARVNDLSQEAHSLVDELDIKDSFRSLFHDLIDYNSSRGV